MSKHAKPDPSEYLGDGIAASVDPWGSIWLSQPTENGTHRITLAPEVYESLVKFVERVRLDMVT